MSVEKAFSITLKLSLTDEGSFESVRLLKGRSKLPQDVLDRLNQALRESLVPAAPVKTTVAIGNDAEQKILNHLLSISQVNNDFSVIDTSSQTGHGDIAIQHQSKRICVEVKNYSKPVPMKEIEKYHKSLALPEYDLGIIIQNNSCGYCAEAGLKTPIDIRVQDGKPSAYLTGIDPQLLYPVITTLMCLVGVDQDAGDLDAKRQALLSIHEHVGELRSCVEIQKKSIGRMETSIAAIAKLSLA